MTAPAAVPQSAIVAALPPQASGEPAVGGPPVAGDPPDVSVLTPVHNTLAYLDRWFESLLGQTLPRHRIEVIAVDDGSTDGSAEQLLAWAEQHPGLLRVRLLGDAGGPARARNHALDLARGRYLYFVDSDDWLGPEALERAVAYADRHGSDIVLPRMTGVGGRGVASWIYERTDPDVSFPDSVLPWSMNVTKLYRREFVERYRLRFPEDLPVYSDQPFAVEAYIRSGRTSVLADYDYYHLVLRPDRSNITRSADVEDRLRAVEQILETGAALLPPGRARDPLTVRHLRWELLPLLRCRIGSLPAPVRRRVLRGVSRLAARHVGESVRALLPVAEQRLLRLAAENRHAELLHLLEHPPAPLAVRQAVWREGALAVQLAPDPDAAASTRLRVRVGPLAVPVVDGVATLPAAQLPPGVWPMTLERELAGIVERRTAEAAPVVGGGLRVWRGARPHAARARSDAGTLRVALLPLPVARAIRQRVLRATPWRPTPAPA